MELASAVQKLVNSQAKLKFEPLPQDDPRRRPDITRAKTFLNWEPKVPLSEGLELTVTDFQGRVQAISQPAFAS